MPLAWSPDDGAPMMWSPRASFSPVTSLVLGRDDAGDAAGQRRRAPHRRLGFDQIAQGRRLAGRQGHAAHLAGPIEALGQVVAPLLVGEPLAVARRHFVGEDHGQGALADDVVGRHKGRIDADALVVGPAGPGVLVHPLGDPVLVAQAFLGHAPEVGPGAPILVDGPVRAHAVRIDEYAATVRERERPLSGPHHGHLERLDLGVIHAGRGVLGFRPHFTLLEFSHWPPSPAFPMTKCALSRVLIISPAATPSQGARRQRQRDRQAGFPAGTDTLPSGTLADSARGTGSDSSSARQSTASNSSVRRDSSQIRRPLGEGQQVLLAVDGKLATQLFELHHLPTPWRVHRVPARQPASAIGLMACRSGGR